jgi:hypothetical protein
MAVKCSSIVAAMVAMCVWIAPATTAFPRKGVNEVVSVPTSATVDCNAAAIVAHQRKWDREHAMRFDLTEAERVKRGEMDLLAAASECPPKALKDIDWMPHATTTTTITPITAVTPGPPKPPPSVFGFSSTLTDHAVLQRAPAKSAVYGTLAVAGGEWLQQICALAPTHLHAQYFGAHDRALH